MTGERSDAEDRYALQVEIVAALRARWERAGKPMTSKGGATGRAVVTHPLLVELQAALLKADRLERSLRATGKRGRQIGESQAPDRQAPPRLRVAK